MAVEGHAAPSRMGVGVIGASPLRPGWAVTAHLPALAALPDYELRAVATSTEASARAAAEAYGVPGHADPAALIARRDVDLVVVTVKLPHHHRLVGEALAAGKLVMCEWPLGVDAGQTADLAARAAGAGLGTLIGLQARMAPSIRYARDLVAQGYVGEVLATTLVGSGIAWTSVTDSARLHVRGGRQRDAALRADDACARRAAVRIGRSGRHPGDECRAAAGRDAGRHARDHHRDGPGPSRRRRDAEERRSRLGLLSWRLIPRRQLPLGDQRHRRRSRADVTRRQSSGARAPAGGGARRGSHERAARGSGRVRSGARCSGRPGGQRHAPLRRLCRRSPRRNARRHRAGLRACPSCASHAGLHYDRGGERHRATSCDGDTDMRVMAVRRAGGPDVLELGDVPEPTPGPGQALVEVHAAGGNLMDIGVRQGLFWAESPYPQVLGVEGAGRVRAVGEGVDAIRPGERVAWGYAPGSYAEHVIVPAAALVPLPDAIDDRTAAAVMMQGLTASHFATDFYPVQPGDVALVHAAAGGVGLLLTQIIKLRGGRVIGRVSRQEKVHAAIEAGADYVIVGTEGDFADEGIRLFG